MCYLSFLYFFYVCKTGASGTKLVARRRAGLINSLHLVELAIIELRHVAIIERGEVIIFDVVVSVNGETVLDHAEDAGSKVRGVVEGELRRQEGSLEEEPDEILDSIVVGVLSHLVLELHNDGVLRVELEGLLGGHVGAHGGVAEGLVAGNTLHVGRVAVLAGGDDDGGGDNTVGNL